MSPPPRSLPRSPPVRVGPGFCITPVPLSTSVLVSLPSHEQGTPPVLLSTFSHCQYKKGGVHPSLCITDRAPQVLMLYQSPKWLMLLEGAASLVTASLPPSSGPC